MPAQTHHPAVIQHDDLVGVLQAGGTLAHDEHGQVTGQSGQCLAQGEEPSAEWISQAFAAIGSQGRTALKRMRELLGVLRETGASDETNPSQNQLNLTPAKSLDEQISAAQSRGVGNA